MSAFEINVITLFPTLIKNFCEYSKIKKAINQNILKINIIDLRQYGVSKRQNVDDYSFSGSKGMVLKVEPFYNALLPFQTNNFTKILLNAGTNTLRQATVKNLINDNKPIVLLCGHYDGVDARVSQYCDTQISIGDYITCGGETPALVVIDCIARLLPQVVNHKSYTSDSFYSKPLLSYPVYTRPIEFYDNKVPDVLMSGNHHKIIC